MIEDKLITAWLICLLSFIVGGQLTKTDYLRIILPASTLQCLVIILQYLNLINSLSIFPVSGTFGNPAPAAYLVCLGAIAMVENLRNKQTGKSERVFSWISLAVFLLCLVICKSRTSIFAFFILTLFLAYPECKKGKFVLLFSFAVIFLIALYQIRPGSANARILVWHVCSRIFCQNPLFGLGAGGLAEAYMPAQAMYFREHIDSAFALVANNHSQSYNEIIHLLCEQGIIGFSIFFIFAVTCLNNGIKRSYIAISIMVISLFSYVSSFGFTLVLLWSSLGSAANADTSVRKREQKLTNIAIHSFIAYIILSLVILVNKNNQKNGHSARYYDEMCELGILEQKNGNLAHAESILWDAYYMIPSRLRATYLLFKMYEHDNPESTRETAEIILSQPMKVHGVQENRILQEVRNYMFVGPVIISDEHIDIENEEP